MGESEEVCSSKKWCFYLSQVWRFTFWGTLWEPCHVKQSELGPIKKWTRYICLPKHLSEVQTLSIVTIAIRDVHPDSDDVGQTMSVSVHRGRLVRYVCVCVIDNGQSKAGFGAELEECLVLKVISSQQIRAWRELWRMSDFSLKKSSTQSLSSNLEKTKLSIDWAIGEQLPWGCLSQLRLNGLVFLRAADSPASSRPIWRVYTCETHVVS